MLLSQEKHLNIYIYIVHKILKDIRLKSSFISNGYWKRCFYQIHGFKNIIYYIRILVSDFQVINITTNVILGIKSLKN